MHSQGRGLLGLAADRQESTPDVQLAASSEELTQRETTTGCEGRGATSACTIKFPSGLRRGPRGGLRCVSKVRYF